MSTDDKREFNIARLPAPEEQARGTMGAEELATILARARAETAGKVVSVGEEQRRQEERETAEREVWEQWQWEQRQVRTLQADARAQRGAGNVAFGRGAAVVSGATLAGFLVGGPVGALAFGAAGWFADHLFGGGRP